MKRLVGFLVLLFLTNCHLYSQFTASSNYAVNIPLGDTKNYFNSSYYLGDIGIGYRIKNNLETIINIGYYDFGNFTERSFGTEYKTSDSFISTSFDVLYHFSLNKFKPYIIIKNGIIVDKYTTHENQFGYWQKIDSGSLLYYNIGFGAGLRYPIINNNYHLNICGLYYHLPKYSNNFMRINLGISYSFVNFDTSNEE